MPPAADAGARDPHEAAGQLMMLRDGAMVSGYLADPLVVGETLRGAFATVLGSSGSAAKDA